MHDSAEFAERITLKINVQSIHPITIKQNIIEPTNKFSKISPRLTEIHHNIEIRTQTNIHASTSYTNEPVLNW
jgi:hypothetical protein